MAEMCEAFWLVADILACQHTQKAKREAFQTWTLTLNTEGKSSNALLVGENGNGKLIAKLEIPYTDFPLSGGHYALPGGWHPAAPLGALRNPLPHSFQLTCHVSVASLRLDACTRQLGSRRAPIRVVRFFLDSSIKEVLFLYPVFLHRGLLPHIPNEEVSIASCSPKKQS